LIGYRDVLKIKGVVVIMNKKKATFIAVPTIVLAVGILFFGFQGDESKKEQVQVESNKDKSVTSEFEEAIRAEENKVKSEAIELDKEQVQVESNKVKPETIESKKEQVQVDSNKATSEATELEKEQVQVDSKEIEYVTVLPGMTLENFDKIVVGDKETGEGGSTYDEVVLLFRKEAPRKTSIMVKDMNVDQFQWFEGGVSDAEEIFHVNFKNGLVFEKYTDGFDE
jgi:type IV secretory pathway VirB10-like protein